MSTPEQRRHARRDWTPLRAARHDVLIIGGGITGAGLAFDLAARGLRVVLAEKGDFASGTSSASTKLIHGGVRYLEQYAFGLVFEACRERALLQRMAPHLVRPQPFFIPVYRGDPRPLWMVRAGMTLYDLLALFRNTRRHSILSPAAALAREPALQPEGLRGVAVYWDCRTDDARLCLENILAAQQRGALVGNYLEAIALLGRGGRVAGARLRDGESGAEFELHAEVVVNATGPWLDRVCALDGEPPGKLRPTRGTHLLVPRLNRGGEALYLTAGSDQRLFFVIPWGELSLVGTTDVDHPGDPDAVAPTAADIDYLLAESHRHLRGTPLRRADVVAAFAGLRPLVREEEGQASRVSREHRIHESESGLISVAGGKYTTYRAMAAEIGDRVVARLGRGARASGTHRLLLPGGMGEPFEDYVAREVPRLTQDCRLAPERVTALLARYGARTSGLLALARDNPVLAQPVVAGSPLLALEVLYAARCEFARTPADVLRRRTSLALAPGRGCAELAAVAELLGQELEAPAAVRRQWVDDYLARWGRIEGEEPE